MINIYETISDLKVDQIRDEIRDVICNDCLIYNPNNPIQLPDGRRTILDIDLSKIIFDGRYSLMMSKLVSSYLADNFVLLVTFDNDSIIISLAIFYYLKGKYVKCLSIKDDDKNVLSMQGFYAPDINVVVVKNILNDQDELEKLLSKCEELRLNISDVVVFIDRSATKRLSYLVVFTLKELLDHVGMKEEEVYL